MTTAPSGQSDPRKPRRFLRAAFVADIENYSGRVSIGETIAFHDINAVLEGLREEVESHDGRIITMPGDGMVVLFESAVEAVRCALSTHQRFSDARRYGGMRLRIGIHLGEVILEGPAPLGEPINVAVRLQSLTPPGTTLVTEDVFNAVSSRIAARFEHRGSPQLRNIPRRIAVFEVWPMMTADAQPLPLAGGTLDRTTRLTDLGKHVAPPAETAPIQPAALPSIGDVKKSAPAMFEPSAIHPDSAARIVSALTRHIGPVAPVVFRRACQAAQDVHGLIDALCGHVPADTERERLRLELTRLLKRA